MVMAVERLHDFAVIGLQKKLLKEVIERTSAPQWFVCITGMLRLLPE
jgi:hypothetical protein